MAEPGRRAATVENAATIAALFALTLLLQWLSGAYRSELAHFPDEPSHVVTSLMFGDYVRAGFPGSPVAYAEKYYVHYPKVAIGMWPPLFYCVAGAWTLVFGATRVSFLMLAALAGGLLAGSLAIFVKRMYGRALGLTAGVVLAFLSPVQSGNSMVMLDIPVALGCFWSMLLLVEYFRSERTRTAIAFGLVTALAMLVKANANACVVMALLMLPLTGRYSLLKRPGLYAAGAIVLVLGLPWQILSLKMERTAVPMGSLHAADFGPMLFGYARILMVELTPLVAALTVVGLAVAAVPALRKAAPDSVALAGAASLLLAILLFHCIEPRIFMDERYMTAALPPALVLFVAGCHALSRLRIRAVPGGAVRTAALVGVALAGAWLWGAFAIPQRPVLGFVAAADLALAANAPKDAMLVCSDAGGEGAFVAEVALRDHRPSRIVLRASKVISQRPWSGTEVKMLLNDTADLGKYLEDVAVDVAVVDFTARENPERALLVSYLEQDAAGWRAEEVKGDFARKLTVYIRTDRSHLLPGRIRFSLPYTLGRDVELNVR